MRTVVDTNVLVSAFLWQGTPGRLIEFAGDTQIQLFTSRALLAELADVLSRDKLARAVRATGLTPAQMLRNYRRLVQTIPVRKLARQIARDPDDDAVLACALAAHAQLIVSGDQDLLSLGTFQGVPIMKAAQAVQIIEK